MDRNAILREYEILRQKSIDLNVILAKALNGGDLRAAARMLGMTQGNNIDLQTEQESSVLIDFAIHDIRRDGQTAIERVLKDNPAPEGSDELRLLHSMVDSHFTIFQVVKTEPGFGVHALDGPARSPIFVVDKSFSRTASPGMGLAARIHSPGDNWWMTTGAALPINRKSADAIANEIRDYPRRHGTAPPDEKTSEIVLRACIAAGAARNIHYARLNEQINEYEPAATPVERGTKVGRNDPCPCGSGKKYKKCCKC